MASDKSKRKSAAESMKSAFGSDEAPGAALAGKVKAFLFGSDDEADTEDQPKAGVVPMSADERKRAASIASAFKPRK